MKKLLFVINNMNVGGIQKSLIELLCCISGSYDVTLFCSLPGGEYFKDIPANVKIIDSSKTAQVPELSASGCKKLGMRFYLFRTLASTWSKLFGKVFPAFVLTRLIGKIPGEYDTAISYSQPLEKHNFCNLCNEIVLNCVKAEKKLTVVHCDYEKYGGDCAANRRLYRRFDGIAAVSDSVGQKVKNAMPDVAKKIFTLPNCCDTVKIIKMGECDPVTYQKRTLITVARLSEEKGILRCIPICKKLCDSGFDFEWHIIGGGPLENQIKERIAENGLQNCIFLHGQQNNPYRFMKNADYFLLPSFHEAAPMVFNEAWSLGIPVLTTETLSAVEMVRDRGIGTVCPNNDSGIFEMLKNILSSSRKPEISIAMNEINKSVAAVFYKFC